jgi:hypothetical protein
MKLLKIIFLFTIAMGCGSCALSACPEDLKSFDSIEDIDRWVKINIKYKSDPWYDPWQTPEETLSLRTGDCEDSAILWLYLCSENGFGKGVMEVYKNSDGSKRHAVGRLGSYQFNYLPSVPIKIFEWSYDWAMGLSVVKGNKEDF